MKRILTFLLFCISINTAYSQSAVPFVFEIQEFQRTNAPGLQSFVLGHYSDYWLLIGGRTEGMHGFPTPPLGGFPTMYANKNFIVYNPVTDSIWTRSIYQDFSVANAEQFRSTNMQAYQTGNTLYLCGGYGKDSSLGSGLLDSFITFPKFTAINVSGMINAIKSNSSVASFVRTLTDTTFAVTGGILGRIGNSYYLTVGQKFTGKYAFPNAGPPLFVQKYNNAIKKFDIVDNGVTLSITNKSYIVDTVNLHRRDLNVVPQITSTSGTQGMTIYGGVFQYDEDVPFVNPVYISANSISVENTFQQKYSQYECPVIPIYDSVRNDMSNLFFGGISLYRYDTLLHKSVIDTCNFGGPAPCVPFISDITAITKFSNGTSKDSVLPVRFPSNRRLGAEQHMVYDAGLPRYSNDVVKLRSLSGRTFAGYLYGGIEAFEANPFLQMINTHGRNAGTVSVASNRIYKIYLTPNTVGINPLGSYVPADFKLFQNYPNPFNPTTKIKFDLPSNGFVSLKIYDVMGREVENLVNENLKAGSYEVEFSGVQKSSGIYYYKVYTEKYQETKKMILVK